MLSKPIFDFQIFDAYIAVYANSMLVSLNARARFRSQASTVQNMSEIIQTSDVVALVDIVSQYVFAENK